ncbi:hypothetical protein M8818_003918 [Zalaria obscura]|uniref:Uncharacterized protein n=1 Tax=Zalaria obscura TaxID=2024903 RepID=A0ACC3SDQ7_9PEZI
MSVRDGMVVLHTLASSCRAVTGVRSSRLYSLVWQRQLKSLLVCKPPSQKQNAANVDVAAGLGGGRGGQVWFCSLQALLGFGYLLKVKGAASILCCDRCCITGKLEVAETLEGRRAMLLKPRRQVQWCIRYLPIQQIRFGLLPVTMKPVCKVMRCDRTNLGSSSHNLHVKHHAPGNAIMLPEALQAEAFSPFVEKA